jgi:hypothetical protein
MAVLAVQKSSLTGLTPTFANASAGGDQFLNDGTVLLHLKTSGTASTVTVAAQTKCNRGQLHDVTVNMGATDQKICGPFPTAWFNDSEGRVNLSYTSVTGLTVAVVDPTP